MKVGGPFEDPRLQFTLRVGWIAVRLLLVKWLLHVGARFYYQGF